MLKAYTTPQTVKQKQCAAVSNKDLEKKQQRRNQKPSSKSLMRALTKVFKAKLVLRFQVEGS